MTDRILLLLAGLASSIAAWALWRYLGQDALNVLILLALISVVAENRRLRRALEKQRAGGEEV